MTKGPREPPDQRPPSPDRVAQDWITLWESELAALATDREAQEVMLRLVGLWAKTARTAVAAMTPAGHGAAGDGPAGRARSAASSGTASAPVASDAGVAAIGRLERRIAELERRLAELERRD
ncbi:MAG TPA: hypothetical protein VME92_13350 [Acetobacteraceae bacterium]|nr:hypothetical protein [Acetobacteraceae bacterium]